VLRPSGIVISGVDVATGTTTPVMLDASVATAPSVLVCATVNIKRLPKSLTVAVYESPSAPLIVAHELVLDEEHRFHDLTRL
jgi:hypothetical protein